MRKRIVLFLVLLLGACGGSAGPHELIGAGMPKTHPDPLVSRFIVMVHPESGERVATVYYHDGHYDPIAMRAIDRLFRDRHAGVVSRIDPELIDFLVDIRTRLGLPPSVTFEILSGYRTPESNAILAQHNNNVASESLHTHGWAVDFRIAGVDGRAIAAIAKTMQRGAAVYYPNSRHVHVDIGAIRSWREK